MKCPGCGEYNKIVRVGEACLCLECGYIGSKYSFEGYGKSQDIPNGSAEHIINGFVIATVLVVIAELALRALGD
jgi:hypothetical protein